MKKAKVKSDTRTKVLQQAAWKRMSRYVRLYGDFNREWKCITCGKPYSDLSQIHAGHYKHDGSKGSPVSYDKRNIWPQCTSCNTFGHGKLDVYAERLVEEYGPDVLSELSQLKHQTMKGKDKKEWLKQVIMDLDAKIEKMEG